jgi:hypothetical protein
MRTGLVYPIADVLPTLMTLKSQPSRQSGVQALRHFAHHLFPANSTSRISSKNLFTLHQVLHRLLQDDDESIRQVAAEIVRQGRGIARRISLEQAVRVWWDWLEERVASVDLPDVWVEWLWFLCADEQGFSMLILD